MPRATRRPLKAAPAALAATVLLAGLTPAATAATKPSNGAVAFSAKRAGSRVIYTREGNGTGLKLIGTDGRADHPAVSPRGRRVAFTKYGPWGAQVWVSFLDGTGLRRLTTGASESMPTWSPDARNVAFAAGNKGVRDLYRIVADGTGLRRLTYSRRNDEEPAWSVRNQIAFVRRGSSGDDIYSVNSNGGGTRRLTRSKLDDRSPAWSPTGRTLVFSRGRAGARDLYVLTADGSRARRLTRARGDETQPTFSPDGTRVAFIHRRRGSRRLYIVKVKGKPIRTLPRRSLRVRRLTTSRSSANAPSWQPAGLDPVIAAAGDIACDPASPYFNGGAGQPGLCRQKLTSDLLLRMDLSAALVVGDLQYENGELENFNASFHPSWGRLKPLLRPIPGNHEYHTAGAAGYFDYFNGQGRRSGPAGERGQGWHSFDIGSWHVIGLNSECEPVGGCDADSPQGRWLRADLAAHPNQCTLAYWHGPRFTSGRYNDLSERVRYFFDQAYASGVDVVLSGHEHFYERYAPQDGSGRADPVRGVRQFTVGMGGKSRHFFRSAQPNSEVRQSSSIGVLEMTLGEGTYDWRLSRAPTSATADAGSGRCH